MLWNKGEQPVALPSEWVLLDGNLGVTASGCFTIGDAVIWADQHSRIVESGNAVQLAGLGAFRVGDHVAAPGYFFHMPTQNADATARRCAAGDSDLAVASLYSPRVIRQLPPCLNDYGTPPFC